MSDITQLTNMIQNLYDKYKEDAYSLQRLQTHIKNLSGNIENEIKIHDKRILRLNELTNEHENFCKIFLSKYKYYYFGVYSLFFSVYD